MRDLSAGPARFVPPAIVPALLAAWLFALPIRGTVAIRNVLLWSVVGLVLVHAWRTRRWARLVPPRPLAAIMLAWAAWCVASVAWSVVPGASLSELRPELATPIAAFLVFYAVTDRPTHVDLWSASLAATLALLAALAIAQQAGTGAWDPRRWHVDVGYYSTFVMLALPWLGWLAWRYPSGPSRAALGAVALATGVVTWWTDNRVVWPAFALMVVLAAVLASRGASARQRAAWTVAAVVALAGAALVFVAAQHERAEMLKRVDAPVTPDFATDPRLTIWPQAIERWTAHPLLGYGFGRPALAMPEASRDGLQDPRYWHAHNVFLDVALELGAVGLAIFAAGLAVLSRLLVGGLQRGPIRRGIAIVGLVTLAGFVAKNFTDDFVVRHVALLCAALAGVLAAAMREDFAATP